MKFRIGKRITVLLTALAMLGLMPGLASAKVPPGHGLTTLECDEFGTAVVTRGGGGPGWVAADGSMWLVVSGTFTGPEGEFSFTQGKKKGLLDEMATCSFSEGPFSAVVNVVRVR
jgi:hypothetical protein